MLKTKLCDILGIEYPVLQGGMAWIATAELAGAVSNAGGLGIIGGGEAPPEIIRQEIKKLKNLTQRPFGVNVYFLSQFVDEIIEILIDEKVPMITTGAGNPGKYIARLKEAGIKVFPVVSSVALAKRLARTDVDGFIAEGMECGGHVGELTTMALVPQIVDATHLPVIAAGGIFDGRGMAAALSLGAVGVQMGTRFVASKECLVHPNYKKALIEAKDRDTVLTGYGRHQVRVLRNKLTREFEKLKENNAPSEDFVSLGAGKLKIAAIDGDCVFGSVMAGQIAAMITEEQDVQNIINDLVIGSERVVRELAEYFKEDI